MYLFFILCELYPIKNHPLNQMTQGGGLLQLVAMGKQDVFLTGNPQVTWFKMVYRRYTNFSTESSIIQFDNQADFGRRITTLIPRKGDLLGPMWLEIQLPALTDSVTGKPVSYTNAIGHALIQEITLEIGEQEIDKQTGEWMEIWSNHTVTQDKLQAWNNMIGKTTGASQGNTSSDSVNMYGPLYLYVPLRFWFCKNPGLALPLIALQYHPVRINITLRPLQSLFVLTTGKVPCDTTVASASITNMRMYGDFVHLDVEERRRFVANSHEYLIEQVQFTPSQSIDQTATTVQIPMEFNHPIKELFWVVQREASANVNQPFNYTNLTVGELSSQVGYQNLITTALLRLDGYDRFDIRNADYFRLVQPYQHHTVIPANDFIYSYSFALRPEDSQPTGSMNASRIDTIVLQLEMNTTVVPARGPASVRIYALNHNVLRITEGFGGILFRI
jgi:hypothetical protein